HNPSAQGQLDELYMLDVLAGHFADHATILTLEEALQNPNVEKYTHLIYLRLNTDAPAAPELSFINAYQGSLYLIGNRLDAFDVSKGMAIKRYVEIDKIYKGNVGYELDNAKSVMEFDEYADAKAYFQGESDNQLFPLIFEK